MSIIMTSFKNIKTMSKIKPIITFSKNEVLINTKNLVRVSLKIWNGTYSNDALVSSFGGLPRLPLLLWLLSYLLYLSILKICVIFVNIVDIYIKQFSQLRVLYYMCYFVKKYYNFLNMISTKDLIKIQNRCYSYFNKILCRF